MSYTVNLNLERQFAGRLEAGLKAAGIFFAAKTRELLSVAAAKKRVKSRRGGTYFRAANRATKGAPPRLVSARLRGSVSWWLREDRRAVRWGANARYARRLEKTGHPFVSVVQKRHGREALELMARVARGGG